MALSEMSRHHAAVQRAVLLEVEGEHRSHGKQRPTQKLGLVDFWEFRHG